MAMEGTRQDVIRNIRQLMLANGVQVDQNSGLEFYTGYRQVRLYDIDLYFETIPLYYLGVREYSKNSLRLFLYQQRHDGFIPRIVQRSQLVWTGDEDAEHCKPFLAQTALLISEYENDYSWITREMFHRLRLYLNYWLDDCDRDGNGLSEWNSAPHGGADNQLERAGGWQANFCEAVDLNCYLYRECLALARIAEKVGQPRQAQDLREAGELRRLAVRERLWDEEDEIFYDRHRRRDAPIKVKYMMSFMTLWCDVATPEQAEASVNRWLLNKDEFWLTYPAATYARSEPTFCQVWKPGDYSRCNFRGSVWIPYNYCIMHGLQKYGFTEAADELARRSYDLLTGLDVVREWYNSETGEGYGNDPFWGFSCIAPFMSYELEHGADPTSIEEEDLRGKMDLVREAAGTLPD